MKYRCSKCHKEIEFDTPMLFCPFCGGNMEEVKVEVRGAEAILINKVSEALSLEKPKFDKSSFEPEDMPDGTLPSFKKVQDYVIKKPKIDALFEALEESIANIKKHFESEAAEQRRVDLGQFKAQIVKHDEYLISVAKCVGWALSFDEIKFPKVVANCNARISPEIRKDALALLDLVAHLETKVREFVISNSIFDNSCWSRYGAEEEKPSKDATERFAKAIEEITAIVNKKYIYDFLGDSSEDVGEMMKCLWQSLSLVLAFSKKEIDVAYTVDGAEVKDIDHAINQVVVAHYQDFEAAKAGVLKNLGSTDKDALEKAVAEIAKINVPGKKVNGPKKAKPMTGFEELDRLIGLQSVKDKARMIEAFLAKNKGKKVMTHMSFEGNPGTGKTEVARIMAKILHECGALPKDKVTEVQRADLVGAYVGHTAIKTQKVIDEAMGGVLFIDEAYSLVPPDPGNDFGPEAVAVLIKAMEDHKGEFCVILAGYKNEMEKMLSSNPGFKSRIQFNVDFPNYSREELKEIAGLILQNQKYDITEDALEGLLDLADYMRSSTDFGNARTLRSFIEQAMMAQSLRVGASGVTIIEIDDIKYVAKQNKIPFKGEGPKKIETPQDKLAKMIGLASVKKMIAKIVATVKKNPGSINLHMAFNGNPGTGKTEVANLLSSILYEAGALPEAKYINCSSADLISKFVGDTAQKTQGIINKAMGGVLFIDEAYALTQEKAGEEAIATLIKAMEDHKGEFCVILAGYKHELADLIASNPGFKSRIQFSLDFNDYSREELIEIAKLMAKSKDYSIDDEALEAVVRITDIRRGQPDFANAREVRNIVEQSIMNSSVRTIGTDEKTIVYSDVAEYASDLGFDISSDTNEEMPQQLIEQLEKELQDLPNLLLGIDDLPYKPNAKSLERSVVCICNERSQGTGFLISPYGHVLTCAHCIHDEEQRVRIAFFDEDGQRLFKYFSFVIVAMDEVNDLALLRIATDEFRFKFLPLTMDKGFEYEPTSDFVMAGYPYGGEAFSEISVTTGKVASVNIIDGGRRTTVFADMFGKPGNSGSPIIDVRTSKVIGVFWGSIGKSTDQINCFTPIGAILSLVFPNMASSKSNDSKYALSPSIKFVEADITKRPTEAIVNAVNTGLWHGGGVDGAVRDAAGPQMDADLSKIGHVDVGGVVVTQGYALSQKYVFHTAGPDCSDYGGQERPDLLRLCYVNCLDKAKELGVHSISFPAISTGIFGYDKYRAALVSLKTLNEWLSSNPYYPIVVEMLCFYRQGGAHTDLEAYKKAAETLIKGAC